MSDPRVTVELLARTDFSLKAVLTSAWGKQWQEVLNDTGTGTVTLANDDPDLALVEYGDILRFSLDGVAAFASIVEQMDRTDIAPAEEYDQNTVLSGRGALAMLEDAVVYPDAYLGGTSPFGDARVFTFASYFATEANQSPVNQTPYDFGDPVSAGNYTGLPGDWGNFFAHWLGAEAPDGSGDNPVGDWWYWALLEDIPEDLYRLYVGYDDAIDLWIDNTPVLANEGSTIDVTKTVDVFFFDVPVHTITARISNRANPSPNPSALILALSTLNPDGSPDVQVWGTGWIASTQYVRPHTDDPPAFTPGEITNVLFSEAIGFGVDVFSILSRGWTATHDSNGVAWAEYINPTFQHGNDLLTAFKQLAESYFDMWIDPTDFTIHLYQTRGGATSTSYTEAVNITQLTHTGQF